MVTKNIQKPFTWHRANTFTRGGEDTVTSRRYSKVTLLFCNHFTLQEIRLNTAAGVLLCYLPKVSEDTQRLQCLAERAVTGRVFQDTN